MLGKNPDLVEELMKKYDKNREDEITMEEFR